MSLHGNIRINGDLIAQWSAQRITNTDGTPGPDDVSTYKCRVITWENRTPRLTTDRNSFTVEHRYGDGAAALASKVLATYAEEMRDR